MARGEGLRVRLSSIPGETPAAVLRAPLYFPAVLNGFGWRETFAHSEYDTVRAGQFSQPAMGPPTARQLRGVDDVEALTMDWEPAWFVERDVDPDEVYDAIFAVGRSRRAVELLVAAKLGDGRPLLRMKITVRSVAVAMRKGEPDSLYYTMSFSEWRDAEVERRAAAGGGGPSLPTSHNLTASDTLHSLAQHYYNSATEYKAIADANSIKGIGQSTPLVSLARFKVGSKIKIPVLRGIKVGASTTSQPTGARSSAPSLR